MGHEIRHEVRTLQPVVTSEQVRAWKEDAAEFARNTLFDLKQFVEDVELRLGGRIQKKVCTHLNIEHDEKKATLFWEEHNGQEVV